VRITGAQQPTGIAPSLGVPSPPTRAPTVNQARSSLRTPAAQLGILGLLTVLGGVLYNALLAFLNARGLPVSIAMVIGTEFLVLAVTGLVLLKSGLRPGDMPALLLLAFFLVDALILSLVNGAPFPEMARNAAVISLFLMIGARVSQQVMMRTFAITAGLVLAVLLLESVWVEGYARFLEPGLYFEQTRGISRFELDEIGLFANAIGFDDRFSILNIVGHRTSSLFLEQVSLANYATILTIFLVSLWGRLPLFVRITYPLLIVGILVTNNSRTALAISLIAPLIYWIAPKLPRLVNLALMPVILFAALIVSLSAPPSRQDDLVGRLSLTIETLRNLNLPALFGARAADANDFLDSGYTFVIYAGSVIGLLVLWLFYSLIAAGTGAALKRANLMTGLYLFLNLTVSGTSVFSIKTAALLWMLVGFLRQEEEAEGVAGTAAPRRTAADQLRG